MKFEELKLRPTLLQCLDQLKFEACTPIQAAVIPLILENKDVFGLAQTGTGKTAAFLLPLMERILGTRARMEDLVEEEKALVQRRAFPAWQKNEFVLVLTPTRELAEQISDDVKKFGASSEIEGVAIYGGASYDPQKAKLEKGVQFVVGTPGRLIDLYKSHTLDLRQVRAIVFDEADRMFDMGFKDDMKFILQRVPKTRQMLMFSATLNYDVLHTAYHFGSEPIEVDVSRDQAKAENVKDHIIHLGQDEKAKFLLSILKRENPRQTIIFSNFKHNVERIADFLSQNGLPAMGISSLLTQAQRNRVLAQFKGDNDRNILVATDVAARGLDIKGVDLVVNFELPDDAENYVHRIGRTGRAGAEGKAFSLVSDRDVDALARIEEYLKHKLDVAWLEDKDLILEFTPFPSQNERPRFGSPKGAGDGRSGGRRSNGRSDGRRQDASEKRGPRAGARRADRSERLDSNSTTSLRTRPTPYAKSNGEGEALMEGSTHQHRDRRSGRHGHGEKSAHKLSQPRANGVHSKSHPAKEARHANGRQDSKRTAKRESQSRHASTRSKGKPRSRNQTDSITQKVTGFIKRLFGGSKG